MPDLLPSELIHEICALTDIDAWHQLRLADRRFSIACRDALPSVLLSQFHQHALSEAVYHNVCTHHVYHNLRYLITSEDAFDEVMAAAVATERAPLAQQLLHDHPHLSRRWQRMPALLKAIQRNYTRPFKYYHLHRTQTLRLHFASDTPALQLCGRAGDYQVLAWLHHHGVWIYPALPQMLEYAKVNEFVKICHVVLHRPHREEQRMVMMMAGAWIRRVVTAAHLSLVEQRRAISVLMQYGADVDIHQQSAMKAALLGGQVVLAAWLLGKGASLLNATDMDATSQRRQNHALIRALLHRGYSNDRVMLIHALDNHDFETIRRLGGQPRVGRLGRWFGWRPTFFGVRWDINSVADLRSLWLDDGI